MDRLIEEEKGYIEVKGKIMEVRLSPIPTILQRNE